MPIANGTQVGPYEVLSPIGAGGMGEVYRARDTRLGREVAIKILPESFASDTNRLHRFEQESRAVAALNHPNLLGIHDVGEYTGCPFLVSELLEGESLRTLLDRGPMPQRKGVEFAVQVAQGLAAAHEKGIIHRDLKPENLFLTRDGRAKILDFGLAKLVQKNGQDLSEGITLTSSHTAPGIVLGTASYMAPEQVRGEATDARTDIFSFGAVLFEIFSGQRAFRRDTPAETMTAVLREDPAEPVAASHPISPALDRIVRRCLEKNSEQRFQSAKDLSFALSALSGTDSTTAPRIAPAASQISWLRWAVILLLMAVVAAVSWWLARRPAAAERQQFAIPVPAEVSHFALSRDGTMLAFVAPEDSSGLPAIFVQRIGSPASKLVRGTEGASFPFWSPDAASLGYFADGKLLKVDAAGGSPQMLAHVLSARGGTWGRKNKIIYSPDSGSALWQVNADGTGAAPLTEEIRKADENTHRWPMFLPDGDHFLFFDGNFGDQKVARVSGIFLSSLKNREKKLLLLCRSSFSYDAHHLYYADENRRLMSVAFDPGSGAVSGAPAVIADTVGFQPSTFWSSLAASDNGTLVYNTSLGAVLSVLSWVDRTGKELSRIGKPAIQANPSISPDGTRFAIDISDPTENNIDIWLQSTDGSSNARFTFDPDEDVIGVWSHDGKTLAYRSNQATAMLTVKRVSGLEQQHFGYRSDPADDILPNSWSLDDRQILCTRQKPTGYSLVIIPPTGGPVVPFNPSTGNSTNGQISPDGKWVAYSSDESGTWEIYVTTFPAGIGKWQVSRGGGREPRWRGDGKEIFYLNPSGMLTAVPVQAGETFSTGAPTPLFQVLGRAPISSTDVFSYDVSKDGTRFLVDRYVKPDKIEPLTIVMNMPSNGK